MVFYEFDADSNRCHIVSFPINHRLGHLHCTADAGKRGAGGEELAFAAGLGGASGFQFAGQGLGFRQEQVDAGGAGAVGGAGDE